MKMINNTLSKTTFLLMAFLISLMSYAQEKSADIKVDIDTKKDSNWYQQPWVWVIGGAVFILLLVALLRGGNRQKA